MVKCGIYSITNKKTGQKYIGQSIDIHRRWKEHVNAKNNSYIHSEIQKYGRHNFIFKVEEECAIDDLNEREIYYINKYNTYENPRHYNLTKGGQYGGYNWRLHNKIHFKPKTTLNLPLLGGGTIGYGGTSIPGHSNLSENPANINNFQTVEFDDKKDPLIVYDPYRCETFNVQTGEVIQ